MRGDIDGERERERKSSHNIYASEKIQRRESERDTNRRLLIQTKMCIHTYTHREREKMSLKKKGEGNKGSKYVPMSPEEAIIP